MSKLVRANKLTITSTDAGFTGTFYLTHKELLTVNSADTNWVADPSIKNRILHREMFRLYLTQNADILGIDWDATDRRAESNIRYPKYTDDTTLFEDASRMVTPDMVEFLSAMKMPNLEFEFITYDEIRPMFTSPKGRVLEEIGILNGKYANSNWAWANVGICAQFRHTSLDGLVSYAWVTMVLDLVSGQLKKPTTIDGGGYNMTSLKKAILDQLPDIADKNDEITESAPNTETQENTQETTVPEVDIVKEKKTRSKKATKAKAE